MSKLKEYLKSSTVGEFALLPVLLGLLYGGSRAGLWVTGTDAGLVAGLALGALLGALYAALFFKWLRS